VSRGAALLVLDMLADADARIAGFGVDTPFDFPFPVAVKTGTSHHYTDNWAVGVTAGFTVAVWTGNFSGRPMRRVSGVTGAGPLLHRAVLLTARRYNPGVLPSPASAGAVRSRVCRVSGARAGPMCAGLDEWFLPGTGPEGECGWHRPQGLVLPAEYNDWLAARGAGAREWHGPLPPARASADGAAFRIVSPRHGDRYEIPPGMDRRYATVALQALGVPEDGAVAWWVDGRRVEAPRWRLEPGVHTMRAVAASGRAAEVTIEVR
jgi:penicillin-binding protein 1C